MSGCEQKQDSVKKSGRIAVWHEAKGFGFIAPEAGGRQVFIHASSLPSHRRHLQVGEAVRYIVVTDAQGRERAAQVELLEDNALLETLKAGPVLASLFALVVFQLAAASGFVPWALALWYAGMSLVLFFFYWKDKAAAQRDDWRTPEKRLHVLAVLGGWPGALAAQHLLRHKSRKRSFRIVFWLTVLLNLAALAVLLWPVA